MKRVAIVGFAGTKEQTPFDDLSVEVWSLNELYGWMQPKLEKVGRRWDRWFELHDMQTITDSVEDQAHLKWLQAQAPDRPVYMQAAHPTIPASVAYPIEKMCRMFGRYFTSSIGYMIALAMSEGRDEQMNVVDEALAYGWIGLYGIDLAADAEYGEQRPNTEYLLGLAQGKGITIQIAKGSALLKADRLYGFEPGLGDGPVGEAYDRKRIRDLNAQLTQAKAAVCTIEGAIQEAENRMNLRRHLRRGVVVPGYSSMASAPMIPAGRDWDGNVVSGAAVRGQG